MRKLLTTCSVSFAKLFLFAFLLPILSSCSSESSPFEEAIKYQLNDPGSAQFKGFLIGKYKTKVCI